eukprot:CAMPEP_0194369288 /NCGR_PEP_ID=MMETSP0174-20130528/17574_1 /TAXON_ID=216777 /ORGANISM="Proboscia alata, Strain PI-D3" /LENGTH=122 /DNA_ID=CAMNT_0039146137 /DNA_START=1 /DNA_END=366 /DNA_ORIENTATION=-
MAVTGGPSNFPTRLVVTIGCWDNVATVARVAIFPHASCLPINGNGNAGSDDEVGVRVGVHRSWVWIGEWINTHDDWKYRYGVVVPVRNLGDAGLETVGKAWLVVLNVSDAIQKQVFHEPFKR